MMLLKESFAEDRHVQAELWISNLSGVAGRRALLPKVPPAVVGLDRG